MPTPQSTLRVDRDRLTRWKDAARRTETSVSAQIRELMDEWAQAVLHAPTAQEASGD